MHRGHRLQFHIWQLNDLGHTSYLADGRHWAPVEHRELEGHVTPSGHVASAAEAHRAVAQTKVGDADAAADAHGEEGGHARRRRLDSCFSRVRGRWRRCRRAEATGDFGGL